MFRPYSRFHTVLTFSSTEQLQLHVTNSDKFSFLFFFLSCWWCLMKWISPSTAHHFLGSCSLLPPGKTAGKCHLRLNPKPCPGMRRLLGHKLRRVQLNRKLFLIELAGPFQRLKSPIRMSPWRGPGTLPPLLLARRRIWIHKRRGTTQGSSVVESPSHITSSGQWEST